MTTKEKITETALDLFSQRGYDGVSVRDIARAVGIRESSIYNHFQGKRAVFETGPVLTPSWISASSSRSAISGRAGCPMTPGTTRPSIRESGWRICRS